MVVILLVVEVVDSQLLSPHLLVVPVEVVMGVLVLEMQELTLLEVVEEVLDQQQKAVEVTVVLVL